MRLSPSRHAGEWGGWPVDHTQDFSTLSRRPDFQNQQIFEISPMAPRHRPHRPPPPPPAARRPPPPIRSPIWARHSRSRSRSAWHGIATPINGWQDIAAPIHARRAIVIVVAIAMVIDIDIAVASAMAMAIAIAAPFHGCPPLCHCRFHATAPLSSRSMPCSSDSLPIRLDQSRLMPIGPILALSAIEAVEAFGAFGAFGARGAIGAIEANDPRGARQPGVGANDPRERQRGQTVVGGRWWRRAL
jgi:hypothetical protein